MGRYQGHITHTFANDSMRPTFGETIYQVKVMYLQWQLDKMQPQEQQYVLQQLQEEGIVVKD